MNTALWFGVLTSAVGSAVTVGLMAVGMSRLRMTTNLWQVAVISVVIFVAKMVLQSIIFALFTFNPGAVTGAFYMFYFLLASGSIFAVGNILIDYLGTFGILAAAFYFFVRPVVQKQ